MLDDVKSVFLAGASRTAFARVQVASLPARCRLRGVCVSLMWDSALPEPGRIDFLLDNDGEDAEVPADSDVIFSAGASNLVPSQSLFIPDDSYIQLTNKLWFTSEVANNLSAVNLTVFYTV
tara:strand:- start:96 stop:458 length:363 start_codon:yes stop_codon:yes gene_type:complete